QQLPHGTRCTQRADGVPDTNHAYRGAWSGPLDVVIGLVPLGGSRALQGLVAGIQIRNVIVIVLLHQPRKLHEARQRSDCEGASTESEEIELVPGHVVVDDRAIEASNDLLYPTPKGTTRELVDSLIGAESI